MYEMEDLYINTCRYSSRNNASLPVVCGWNIDILLPVISKMPGFVLYTLGSMSPDGYLAISVYRSETGLQAFRQTMADFISEFYTQDPPQMTSGKLDALVLPNTDADARCSKPHYFSYRRYAAIAPDIARKSERHVHASLMPFMTDQTCFRMYAMLATSDGVRAGINVSISEEEILAVEESCTAVCGSARPASQMKMPEILRGNIGVFALAQ